MSIPTPTPIWFFIIGVGIGIGIDFSLPGKLRPSGRVLDILIEQILRPDFHELFKRFLPK